MISAVISQVLPDHFAADSSWQIQETKLPSTLYSAYGWDRALQALGKAELSDLLSKAGLPLICDLEPGASAQHRETVTWVKCVFKKLNTRPHDCMRDARACACGSSTSVCQWISVIVFVAADRLPGQIHRHEPPSFCCLQRVAFTLKQILEAASLPAQACALPVAVPVGCMWPLHEAGVTGPSLGPAGTPHTWAAPTPNPTKRLNHLIFLHVFTCQVCSKGFYVTRHFWDRLGPETLGRNAWTWAHAPQTARYKETIRD